jgi:hypothetical protein
VTSRALAYLLILGIGLLVISSSFDHPGVSPARVQLPVAGSHANQAGIDRLGATPRLFFSTDSAFVEGVAAPDNVSLYSVLFHESGLAAGSLWSVSSRGNTTNSSTSKIVLQSPPGNFSFTVHIPRGYLGPTQGVYEVTDKNVTVSLAYDPLVHLTFEEVGLVPGWNWSVTLNGSGTNFTPETRTSLNATIVFQQIPGFYNFTAIADSFTALPSVGNATVGTLPSTVTITYVPFPGTLHLSVSPSAARVWIDGVEIALDRGLFSANETPGLYAIEALAPGFAPYFNNVSLTRGNETTLVISLESLGGGVGSGAGTSISPLALTAIVGLLIVVVLLLIGVAYYRARVLREPPSDVSAETSAASRSQQHPPAP